MNGKNLIRVWKPWMTTGKDPWRLGETSIFVDIMEIKVIWKDGTEERALALMPTTGLGIGDLVSKVMVERDGEKVFFPCHMTKEIHIKSFGKTHVIREAAPVTVNMLQR